MSDHDRLIKRLETIADVTESDKAALRALPFRLKRFEENQDLVVQGEKPTDCCLILEGLAARYKFVAEVRRAILSLHFPGDLPDLQSLQLERMDHSLTALTPVRAAFIPHSAVRTMIHNSAKLNDLIIRYSLIDASIFRQWIANISQLNAYERIAHLLCEVSERMRVLNLLDAKSFQLPMTQSELGDATGLSTVHVNRVLQRMRKEGLIVSKGDIHLILDRERLRAIADFNVDYLHFNARVLDET
jgi:CRP-like cAMP-binding protein